MVRRARSSRGAFRTGVGERVDVRRVGFRAACLRVGFRAACLRVGFRAACLRAGVARRVGRFLERLAEAGFPAGFAFLAPRRALRLAI
jgi:hypothetical protein